MESWAFCIAVWIFLYQRKRFAARPYESSWTRDGYKDINCTRLLSAANPKSRMRYVSRLQRNDMPHLFLQGDHVHSRSSGLLNASSASLSIFLVFFVKCSHRHSYIWQKESFWKWKNLLSDKLEKRNEAKYMLLAKCILMPVVHLVTLLSLMIFWMVAVHLTS